MVDHKTLRTCNVSFFNKKMTQKLVQHVRRLGHFASAVCIINVLSGSEWVQKCIESESPEMGDLALIFEFAAFRDQRQGAARRLREILLADLI